MAEGLAPGHVSPSHGRGMPAPPQWLKGADSAGADMSRGLAPSHVRSAGRARNAGHVWGLTLGRGPQGHDLRGAKLPP